MAKSPINFTITPLTANDVNNDFIGALNRLIRIEYSPDARWIDAAYLLKLIGTWTTTIFVAREDKTNRLLGTSTCVESATLDWGKAWLEDVVVDPTYQGKKIGLALTIAVILEAQRRGIQTKLDLTAGNQRVTAQLLYQKLEWEIRDSKVMRLDIGTYDLKGFHTLTSLITLPDAV